MTQLESGNAAMSFLRRATPAIPRQGLDGSLAAPGLVPLPYFESQSQIEALQLARALSVTGDTVGYAGRLAQQAAAEREREAALTERERLAIAGAHKGLGIDAAQAAAPALTQAILDGTLTADGRPNEQWLNDVVQQRASGLPPDAQDAFRAQLEPHFQAAVVRRNEKLRLEAIAANQDRILAGSAGSVGATDINDRVKALVANNPSLSETDAWHLVGSRALEYQARYGTADGLDWVAAALPEGFDKNTVAAAREIRRKQDQADAVERVFAGLNSRAPMADVISTVDSLRESGALDEQRAAELRSAVVSKAQAQTEDDLRTRILTGAITPAEVGTAVRSAAKLPGDDPRHIPARAGESILADSVRAEKLSLAKLQVAQSIAGARVNLTESQHGEAFSQLVGPEGAGFIDAANRVAMPMDLAAAVLNGRILPPAIRQTLVANITSNDPEDVAGAAVAAGAIGSADPRLYAQLLDSAGPGAEPALTAAVEQYNRGRLQNEATRAQAVLAVRGARAAEKDLPRPAPDALASIAKAGVKLPDALDKIVADVRGELPHTKDALLGIDFLNPDPSLGPSDTALGQRMQRWFADRYAQVEGRLPREKAVEAAAAYTKAKVKNGVDFVRWDNAVTPVAIDVGEGLRLPEALRWGAGFEEEAKADLKARGFSAADVVTMRPFLDPAARPAPLSMTDRPPGWTDAEEKKFAAWYAPIAKANKLDANPDDPEHHYNYRFAFRAGAAPGEDGHWPSRFKDAAHPNRYVNGVDTTGAGNPEARMGWLYVTADGSPLADDAGRALLFRPSDRAAKANDEFRRSLDAKASGFVNSPAAVERMLQAARATRAFTSDARDFVPFNIPALTPRPESK